jgi:hypothetical protein
MRFYLINVGVSVISGLLVYLGSPFTQKATGAGAVHGGPRWFLPTVTIAVMTGVFGLLCLLRLLWVRLGL